MEETDPETAFRELETDDEITIETPYGDKINRQVTRETAPRKSTIEQHVFVGPHEHCRVLTYSQAKETMLLKTIESDGSLSVPGKNITSFTNWDKEHSFSTAKNEI